MKILFVHNFYGSSAPSGENQVVEAEIALLRSFGHEVETFTRHSDEIRRQPLWGSVKGALATPWNPWMASALKDFVQAWNPDVVHVHNTFPLISPAIFHAIGPNVARVLTLHNYRLLCAAAIPMRSGKVCLECLDTQSVFPALRHGCYRHSRVATFPITLNISLHRRIGTWQSKVDAFITFTEFQRGLFAKSGLPFSKIHVKPNFYIGSSDPIPWVQKDNYVVFVGRLSNEKGVLSLLHAWSGWCKSSSNVPELRIVGDGPLRSELELMSQGLPVRFLGQVSGSAAREQIARAKLLVLPSECFEGFPMVIAEAFALGTPVATSNLGPLPTIVENNINGVLFEPNNPLSLKNTIQEVWEAPGRLETLRHGALSAYQAFYNPDSNYAQLINIYERAIESKKTQK